MSEAVTDESLNIMGMIDITLRHRSLTLHYEVQVIRNVSQGFILSCDFHSPHGCDFGHGKRTVLNW